MVLWWEMFDFYFFYLLFRSHENTKTDNELLRLNVVSSQALMQCIALSQRLTVLILSYLQYQSG